MPNISQKRYDELLAAEEELNRRLEADRKRAARMNAVSEDERKARAKKAIEARWAKYRANKG